MQTTIDLQIYQQITPIFSYNVFEMLGGGNYGRVYKGYDKEAKKIIAVKHIPLKILRQIKNMYQREVKILEKLKHRNIIEYYGSHGGPNNMDGLFLFFQLCQKGTLSEYIIKKKPTQAESLSIFKQLIQGMTYVNSQQIFHRDLKPENLLMTVNDELKIADFGTANQISLEMSQDMTYRRCTPVYAAPEVYILQVYVQNGKKYTQKCDVFSAGYILYQLLTGQLLTQNIQSEEQLSIFLRGLRASPMKIEHPALTERWKILLKRMLSFSPSQRPTFAEIKSIINNFQQASNSPPIDRELNQEQKQYSQKIVESVSRTLQEQQRKTNYYTTVLKIFQSKKNVISEVFPRISKLILIFYSLTCYVKQAEEGLNFLNDPLKLYIDGFDLEKLFGRMASNDRAEVLKFIQQKANKLNKAVQQIKSLLNRQIIPEIDSIYGLQETNPQRIYLLQFRAQSDIKRYREGQFMINNTYVKAIKKCLSGLYQTDADLQVLGEEDLKMYLVVLIVANLQEIIREIPNQNAVWPLKYNQIELLNKRSLIKQIQKRRLAQI